MFSSPYSCKAPRPFTFPPRTASSFELFDTKPYLYGYFCVLFDKREIMVFYDQGSLTIACTGDDAMTKIMTPSKITSGQIAKITENLSAALRKSGFDRDSTQVVFEARGDALIVEFVSAFRRCVNLVNSTIIYRIRVNRGLTQLEAINAMSRVETLEPSVVAGMPKGEEGEVEIHFFELDYDPTLIELDREMKARRLTPDPIALYAFNEANPAFADSSVNATQWRDEGGNACCIVFSMNKNRERKVYVYRRAFSWPRSVHFAGVRK